MPKVREDKFLTFIKTAIADAEGIDCSFAQFVDGLRTMKSELDERLYLAEHELENMDERP